MKYFVLLTLTITLIINSSCSEPEVIITAPVLNFYSSIQVAKIGEPILFDASTSYDEDDTFDNLLFQWDLKGNREWTVPLPESSVLYQYDDTGTYHAKCRVIDPMGWTDEKSLEILVESDSLQ